MKSLGTVLISALLWTSFTTAAPAAPPNCDRAPTGFSKSDYQIGFTVPAGLMPDPKYDDLPASLNVHRVRPEYANGRCDGVQSLAAVLVHGRSSPGSLTFDFQHPEGLSMQEDLALDGIESFAPDLLGYGLSTQFDLDDPANASLPAYNPDGTCSNPVGCDRTRLDRIFPLNQQGRFLGDGLTPQADGLGKNPLDGQLRPHTSSVYFANIDVWVRDILQVIDDAIAKAQPRAGKVALIGYSFGGPRVGKTLYDLGTRAGTKISRVVFLSSLFNRLPGQNSDVNLPTEENDLSEVERSTSFPLTVTPVGVWDPIPANRVSACAGRIADGAEQARADQMRLIDPLGGTWGGGVQGQPTGLLRFPTFSLHGWNPGVAAGIDVPTLVLQGSDDVAALPINAANIFDSLTGTSNKALVQIECASHAAPFEACIDASRCDDADPATIPYGQTAQKWDGPHRTIFAAISEWIREGTFNDSECGRFQINRGGLVASSTPCST